MREFGAQCITSADDIRELLQLGGVGPGAASYDDRPATDDATRVRDALSMRSWRDADDLARRAGMGRGEIEVILGLLSLDGEVERQASSWRRVGHARRG
jgi:DNA processing protein